MTDAWPLHLGPDGKVVINPSYLWSGKGGELSFALSDRLLVARNLMDPATGKILKAMDRERLGNASSLAGKYLYLLRRRSSCSGRFPARSPTQDQRSTIVSDPAAPRKVGENVLAIPGFTPDISAKHFPKAAELYPTAGMIVGHSNYQGIGFNCAVDTSRGR